MKVLARHFGFPLLALLGVVSCSGEPGTYEECLLELAHDQTADDARSICHELFIVPGLIKDVVERVSRAPSTPPPFWVGSFYYRSSPACLPMQFRSGGQVSGGDRCGIGSKIECDGDGPCLLACVEQFGSDETGVFEILEMPPGDTVHGSAVVLRDVESRNEPVTDWHDFPLAAAQLAETFLLGEWHLYEQLTVCEQKKHWP